MLRHVVMIMFKEEYRTIEVTNKLKKMLLGLADSIDKLNNIEVGINISTKQTSFDVVLTADFNDENGLNDYRVHPEHVKVLEYLNIVMEKAAVVDYIT